MTIPAAAKPRVANKLGRRRGVNRASAARYVLQALRADPMAAAHTVTLWTQAKRHTEVSRRVGDFKRDVLLDMAHRGYLRRDGDNLWLITTVGMTEIARITAADEPAAAPPPAVAQEVPPADALEVPPELLIRGVARALCPVDVAPCTQRAGSTDALQLPSRRGNRLYWRDRPPTDLEGNAVGATFDQDQPGAACA